MAKSKLTSKPMINIAGNQYVILAVLGYFLFKIGLAVLAEYHKKIRVREIPIEFRDRDYGQSKMNRGVVYDYLRQLGGLARIRMGM